jgi:putative hemolysin
MAMPRLFASLRALTGRARDGTAASRTEPSGGAVGESAAHDDTGNNGLAVRPEELEALITRTLERDQLRAPPIEMLRRVLYLAETTAAEVMTPRTEVLGIREHTSLDEAAAWVLETGHSRYPVFRNAMDQVIGVVLARDVWRAQVEGAPSLAHITRPPLFVPDTKPLDALLREMQREQTHMAIVVDEFGGTAGIVTIEDVIEEIVGEIADELDEAPAEFEVDARGAVTFPGSVAITELNDRFELDLPDEDFTTVGGFVLGRLGRLAHVGDTVPIRGGRLRVIAMRKRRVDRLAFERDDERRAAADDETRRT